MNFSLSSSDNLACICWMDGYMSDNITLSSSSLKFFLAIENIVIMSSSVGSSWIISTHLNRESSVVSSDMMYNLISYFCVSIYFVGLGPL